MFLGVKSRWITICWCKCAKPSKHCKPNVWANRAALLLMPPTERPMNSCKSQYANGNANTVLAQMACMLMMNQKPCPQQPSNSVRGTTTHNNNMVVGRPHLTLCSAVRQLNNNNTIDATMRRDVQIAQTMMQQ